MVLQNPIKVEISKAWVGSNTFRVKIEMLMGFVYDITSGTM